MSEPPLQPGASPADSAAPDAVQQAMKGLCPRCGAPTLFSGTIKFADRCSSCDLDFSSFNVGDGPAAFLTLGLGTLVTILALVVDALFRPPLWVHVLLWVPITIAMIVGSLRVAKAALIAAEYRNAAREGRIVKDGDVEDRG